MATIVKGNWQRAREELRGAGNRQVGARGPNPAGLPGWREVGKGGRLRGGEHRSWSEAMSASHRVGVMPPGLRLKKQHQGERFSRTEQRERSRVGSWINKAHMDCAVLEFPNP